MSEQVGGIDLRDIEATVRKGLAPYQEMISSKFRIRIPVAAELARRQFGTDLGGLYASTAPILGDVDSGKYAQLDVVVLPPGEGTGNCSEYGPLKFSSGLYPNTHMVFPRSRLGVLGEAVLSIAAFREAEPVLHALHLDKTGVRGGTVVRVAELGQDGPAFHLAMTGIEQAAPYAEYTIKNWDTEEVDPGGDQLLGAPYALYNATPYTQVTAILSIPGHSGTYQRSILELLGAELPM